MNLERFGFKPKKEDVRRDIDAGLEEYADKDNEDLERSLETAREPIPMRKTNEILAETPWEEIYDSYAQAISRRGREPLSSESFFNHFFDGGSLDETFAYGDREKGYLLGFNKFKIFIPTHFAPKTMRGGYELMQDLGESQNPAVMAITEDLGRTLDKMPTWNKVDIDEEILSYFRGDIVKKEIYYNSSDKVRSLMAGLLLEYLNESRNYDCCQDEDGDEGGEDDGFEEVE